MQDTQRGQNECKCTEGTLRGMGPSTCVRIAKIKSGRSISQQGLTATCKDLPH